MKTTLKDGKKGGHGKKANIAPMPQIEEANGRYEREDWTLFRSVRTISQLSGVPPDLLRRLVAKELADNALDAGGTCKVGTLPDGGFYVEDDGPGISESPSRTGSNRDGGA